MSEVGDADLQNQVSKVEVAPAKSPNQAGNAGWIRQPYLQSMKSESKTESETETETESY